MTTRERHSLRWIAFVAVPLLLAISGGPAAAKPLRALWILEPIGIGETRALVTRLEGMGVRVEHVVPGRAIIGRVEDASAAETARLTGVRGLYSEGQLPAAAPEADPLLRGALAAWEEMTSARETEPQAHAAGAPFSGDAAHPPASLESPGVALAPPPGADFFDTSEFFLGSITLAVLFPESDGTIDPNQEDWTPAEEAKVVSEVMSGMGWWIDRGEEIGHQLTFFYDFRTSIDQGYEPITRPSGNHNLWTAATLAVLGYTANPSFFVNTRQFLNDERDTFGTDWAVAAFVIDDTVDPDDNFTGGYFAFSYYGGPLYWFTYGNAGWGEDNMDMIAAHELGHSFYAFDEYPSSGCICTESMGYLNGRNQNCQVGGCTSNIPECIMASGTVPISANVLEFNTAKQIGLLDADGDSIPNILDEFPTTALDPFGSDSTNDPTPAYTGSAAATPKPNLNTNGQRHNITLNVISLVECRVDGGSWTPATPGDGAFDEASETFSFTTAPLANGSHVVQARAVHSYGNIDATPAADTILVFGSPVSVPGPVAATTGLWASPNPSADRIALRFETPASGFARLVVYASDGRRVATLSEGTLPSGRHEIAWDGRASGSRAAAGVYIFRLETAGGSESVKATLLR